MHKPSRNTIIAAGLPVVLLLTLAMWMLPSMAERRTIQAADKKRGYDRTNHVCQMRCGDGSGGPYSVECLSGKAAYLSPDCEWYCTCKDGFQFRVY